MKEEQKQQINGKDKNMDIWNLESSLHKAREQEHVDESKSRLVGEAFLENISNYSVSLNTKNMHVQFCLLQIKFSACTCSNLAR